MWPEVLDVYKTVLSGTVFQRLRDYIPGLGEVSLECARLEYPKPAELTFHCTEAKGKEYFKKEGVCIVSC